jgi:hypothetical protein
MASLLAQLRNGLTVYDRTPTELGQVEMVKFSDEDPQRPPPKSWR